MSDDQVKRVGKIADEGIAQIEKAASFRLPWDSKDKPTAETIRKLVEGPEFRAAKQKTRRTAREAWDAVIGRIEAVLNDTQRANYRKILGKPFDLAKLQFEQDQSETDMDAQYVRLRTWFRWPARRPRFRRHGCPPHFHEPAPGSRSMRLTTTSTPRTVGTSRSPT